MGGEAAGNLDGKGRKAQDGKMPHSGLGRVSA